MHIKILSLWSDKVKARIEKSFPLSYITFWDELSIHNLSSEDETNFVILAWFKKKTVWLGKLF